MCLCVCVKTGGQGLGSQDTTEDRGRQCDQAKSQIVCYRVNPEL